MTFDDWFYSRKDEGFALNAEYFYEDSDMPNSSLKSRLMKEWLTEAFDAGRKSVETEGK